MFALSNGRVRFSERSSSTRAKHKLKAIFFAFIGSVVASLFAAAPAGAAGLKGSFSGNAYATFANAKAGPLAATLGLSAFQGCSCNGTNGQILTTEVDNLSATGLFAAGITQATAFADKTETTAQVQNTASVGGLNALGGLITADTIKAVATVSATKSMITPTSDGSQLANLVIAGQSIPANVPQNTVVQLPGGLGSVTLYKVTTAGSLTGNGNVTVDMVTIAIKAKTGLGLAAGTKIVIGHAVAGFSRKEPVNVYGGNAYAAVSNTTIGNGLQNQIGRSAFLSLGCRGSAGKTKTSTTLPITVNGVMTLGDGATTAFGGTEGGAAVSRMTSTVSGVNLLGGVITVGTMQAVAQSSLQDGVTTGSADGSGFTGLIVAGVPVPLDAPPNTTLSLPLLGTVTINEQTIGSNGNVAVNGLHIKITTVNLLGLPVGSELILAHATSSIAKF